MEDSFPGSRFLNNPFLLVGTVAAFVIVAGLIVGLVLVLFLADFENLEQLTSVASALASTILVLVTGAYMFLTWELVRETRESREQDVAPIVALDLIEMEPTITNHGNGPASNIEFTLSGVPDGPTHKFSLLHLRPGERKIIYGEAFDLFKTGDDEEPYETIRMEGSCEDGFGNHWPIEWEFDGESIHQEMHGLTGLSPV